MIEYRRVRSLERSVSRGRRFVQTVDGTAPVELSGSAPIVWDLLSETGDPLVIEQHLSALYSDEPGAIAAGVRSALDQLIAAGLVEGRHA